MAGVNDYNKRLIELDSGTGSAGGSTNPFANPTAVQGAGSTPKTNPTGSTTEDYYKLARNQEYTALLDREVQLENAKANAMKYTQNQINAQGFGGTGYGSSMQGGIYNAYLNRLGEAQNQTASNVQNLNMQERQEQLANANDRFESITTMLTQADSVDSMNSLLTDYGYGSVDANGEFQWGQKPEGMSDDDWYQMRYYYGLQKNALDQMTGNANAQWAQKVIDMSGGSDKNGATAKSFIDIAKSTKNETTIKETSDFFMNANDGDVLQFISNTGADVYYIYYNGKMYEVEKSLLGDKKPSVVLNMRKK